MTKEQILKAYLEDELLIEKNYLKDGEGLQAKWSDHSNNKMIDIIKLAIDGVVSGDSQPQLTRKVNQYLEP